MERVPPPNLVACLVSPHQSLGADVQTLLYQRDPGHSSADPASHSTPQPPPRTGLLSRRWGGEMAVRTHGDT